ncbi:UNVERIFIED_CONTAM: protein trichome birefringence-like 42 [Sesamum radiatum]|uniref:Protein trichome birefringence-like 42 n=1 Tax=Sesamum radiatum TaxID=300843 RepID=A0AAW2K3U5_SESRA
MGQLPDGDQIFKDMDVFEAYRIALTTWANWVDSNVDPFRTRVFFQGISASYYRMGRTQCAELQWTDEAGGGVDLPGNIRRVVKGVLSSMMRPAVLLDIALLTQLRKDGHPSTYADVALDCSHWCLCRCA